MRAAAAALLAVLLCALPWPYGGVTPAGDAILAAAAAFATACAALERLSARSPATPGGPAARVACAAAVALAGWAALGAVPLPRGVVEALAPRALAWRAPEPGGPAAWLPLSLAPDASLDAAWRGLAAALVGFVALRVVRRHHDALAIVLPVACVGAAASAYALADVFSGGALAPWHPAGRGPRAHAPFVNANHLAALAAAALPCQLAALAWKAHGGGRFGDPGPRGTPLRIACLGALLVTVAGLLATLSRGGVLAAGVGVAVFFLRAGGARAADGEAAPAGAARARWAWPALVAVAGFVAAFGIEPLLARFAGAPEDGVQRSIGWRMALGIFAEFPLTGAGAAAFPDLSPAFQPVGASGWWDAAHDDWLDLAARLGSVGVALALVGLGALVAGTARPFATDLRTVRRLASAAGCGGVAALAAHAVVDFPLQIPALLATGAALAGLALASTRPVPATVPAVVGAVAANVPIRPEGWRRIAVRGWPAVRTFGLLGLALACAAHALAAPDRAAMRARAMAAAAGTDPGAVGPQSDVERLARRTHDPIVVAAAGRYHERRGDAVAAAAAFGEALARRPLDPDTRLRRARSLMALGDGAGAAAECAAAARLAGHHPLLLLHCGLERLAAWKTTGDLAALRAAAGHIRAALARDPSLVRVARDALGADLASVGNLAALVPDAPGAWRAAAEAFAAADEWAAAADAWARAGPGGATGADAALAQAHAEFKAGRPEAAVARLESVLAAAEPRGPLLGRAAAILRAGAAPDAADRVLAAWASRWPDIAESGLALARARLEAGSPAGALEALDRLPPGSGERVDVLDLRGEVAMRAGQPEAAEGYFRRAVAREPGRVARWVRWIGWLEGRGRIEEALAEADRARQLHRDDRDLATLRERLLGKAIRPGR